MRKEDKKKLWFHTIVCIFLLILILGAFGFFKKQGESNEVMLAIGSILLSIVLVVYPWFMIKWFRKNKEENKPGAWDYLTDRWFWKGLLFGIIFSIINVIIIIAWLYDLIKNF